MLSIYYCKGMFFYIIDSYNFEASDLIYTLGIYLKLWQYPYLIIFSIYYSKYLFNFSFDDGIVGFIN